jgi:hypothetical protein
MKKQKPLFSGARQAFLAFRLPASMLEQLDAFAERRLLGRSSAARLILRDGLDAEQKVGADGLGPVVPREVKS